MLLFSVTNRLEVVGVSISLVQGCLGRHLIEEGLGNQNLVKQNLLVEN